MYMAAFVILVLCVALGGGFGLWAGSWLYHLCPLKGNAAYIFGCFILCPAVCIGVVVSTVMPIVYFLIGVGRK
jgi:hypothetical protein